MTWDGFALRSQFPTLHQEVNGQSLVYLDNGATTQKPSVVLEALERYYVHDNANVHRGVHSLSQRATVAYEAARAQLARLIGADQTDEVIFVRGGTEAINLVAQTAGAQALGPGDEVLITVMEHHSNIVPWQLLAERVGATVRAVPMDERGVLDQQAYQELLSERLSRSSSSSTAAARSRTIRRKGTGCIGSSPRCLRAAFTAALRKYRLVIPGISTGY